MRGYTTYGSVRGGCGNIYPTREAAERAARGDGVACSRQGGYSDRRACAVGDDWYLYRDDACKSWVPGPGGRSCGGVRYPG